MTIAPNANAFYSLHTPVPVADVLAKYPTLATHEAHASRSAAYKLISTADVMRSLESQGLHVHGVTVAKVRKADKKGFERHLIRMRQTNVTGRTESPEVVIINSHDGSSKWALMAGMIRFACANGIVTGSNFGSVAVRHGGKDVLGDVIDATYTVVDQFQALETRVDAYKAKLLTSDAIEAFTVKAHAIRYPVTDKAPCAPAALGHIRRRADMSPDLWTVFNVVQENSIRGGLKSILRNEQGRTSVRTTRAVTGIDSSLGINRRLFDLADEFLAA